MRAKSYTVLIIKNNNRTKQNEDNNEETNVSESIDANYMDMINYALFGLIKIEFEDETINN